MENAQQILPSVALQGNFDLPDEEIVEVVNAVADEEEFGNYHTFRINNLGFLLPRTTLSELLDGISFCRIPSSSGVLVGMANLRGSIIPLFDLHTLLGSPLQQKWDGRVLVIGSGNDAVGVVVTELPQTVTIGKEQKLETAPPIPNPLRPFLHACYEKDGIWLRINFFEFFGSISKYI